MAEYYRTIFTIEESTQGLGLLEKVSSEARKWAGHEFGEPLDDVRGDLEGTGGRLRFDTRSVADSGIFWLVWERPDPHDPEPQWRLGLRLATEGDDMEADIEVRGVEGGGEKLDAKPPEVVSILFNKFHCTLDEKPLITEARRATLTDSSFFQDDLFNPSRSIPLLVVSEETMDADYLQRQLLGLVSVISYDRDTAWETSKNLPRPLRCYDGAIRLYSPGCAESDVSQQHPYWLPGDVDRMGPERMCLILRDECVNRLPRRGRRRLFSRVRDAIRRQEAQDLEAKLERQAIDDDTILSLLEMTDDNDADSVSISKFNVLMKLARAFKNKADILEDENKRFKDIGASPAAVPPSSKSRHAPEEPAPIQSRDGENLSFGTVLDVVNWADSQLDGLRFFSSALEEAGSVTKAQFSRTDELCKTFRRMEECARKRPTGLGKNPAQWFSDRGVGYSPKESEQTWARYREDRTFPDDDSGDFVYMEEHFKLRDAGFMLRIHVSWDKKENEWLVGYVGPHLPTATDPH